ncbi:unnamed protein product [Coregonus sp. 'balchen']|nr:unnamed protein product [Coregonus sp. 'balchen']
MFSAGTFPGNLSLLLSHFNEEDQGDIQNALCQALVRLTSLSTQASLSSCSAPALTPRLNLTASHGISIKKNSGSWVTLTQSAEVEIFNTENSPGNLSVLLSHFTKSDVRQYRCGINNGQYRTFNLIVKGKRSTEDPSVTYSTIDHMKGKGKAAVSLESSGETEYASIKMGRSS